VNHERWKQGYVDHGKDFMFYLMFNKKPLRNLSSKQYKDIIWMHIYKYVAMLLLVKYIKGASGNWRLAWRIFWQQGSRRGSYHHLC
jgi:hypothetical protein